MENIAPIVTVLDRDNSLELGSNQRTYDEDHEPVQVDWPTLYPTRGVRRDDDSGEIIDDPWEEDLPAAVIERILDNGDGAPSDRPTSGFPEDVTREDKPIWDVCAWYQPIHFFAYDWGIYIREDCLIALASKIAARCQGYQQVPPYRSANSIAKSCLRAAFATFYLHEHFHHKVESMGLRVHVVKGNSAYLPYKRNVYQKYHLTDHCLEEALANADAYQRLSNAPYKKIMGPTVTVAAKSHLINSFPQEAPGYRKAIDYLTSRKFRAGTHLLMGQIKEAVLSPVQTVDDWEATSHLLHCHFSLRSDIYTVVPRGKRPLLPANVFPTTCSSKNMIKLYNSRGYSTVPGGKGSHVKLKKSGAPTMILPTSKKTLSPGVLNSALKNLGDYSIRDIGKLLQTA